MSVVTYGESYAPAAATAAAPRKGWFARFIDNLIEARMQQAAREVEVHLGYLPYKLERRDGHLVMVGPKDLPSRG